MADAERASSLNRLRLRLRLRLRVRLRLRASEYPPIIDTVDVTCPYCFEVLELYVDPETRGEMVQDCDVCCRPWTLHVTRGEDGLPIVSIQRAQ